MYIKKIIKPIIPATIISVTKQLKVNVLDYPLSRFKIKKILSKKSEIRLELGATQPRTGWITIDKSPGADIKWDLLQGIPFPDNSVDCIYTSHFLEHLYTRDILQILRECLRILKKNGNIRHSVPNGAIYIDMYIKDKSPNFEKWFPYLSAREIIISKIDFINYMAYMGENEHKHLFDLENLIEIHKLVGFRNTQERNFEEQLDSKDRDYESIYIIAHKY